LLVADDEDALRRGVVRILTAAGFDVVEAKDGLEATEQFAQGSFDAILTDLWMPNLSGIGVLRAVRETDLMIPVLLMSVAPNVEAAVDALRYGATDFITKPADPKQLERKVRRAVDLHHLAIAKQEAMRELGSTLVGASDRAGLEVAFERAVSSLYLAYQPIVDIESKTIYGYEALLRGEEPALPSPEAVLEAAERLGRLPEVGRMVRARAPVPLPLAAPEALLFVNLHAIDLMDETLFDTASPLARVASRVVLEITERASLDHVPDARATTARLRAMGFRIAIDDLGAGYAGLTSFAQLEPEFVKLDMTLVRDVQLSPVKQKLISKMISLCADMGIIIIAEGIETDEERAVLTSLGCRYLQGYLFARPGRAFPQARF
jgi:EAL domain-containing protein (putative c-di-GMP-specific phosphodiesterase class I)